MQKKLIVAAVAGALAAPAVAVAQSSTVQIYGLLNVEYGLYVDNIANAANVGRNTTDELNSGASRIGFRGEEKLGGGLSAWFQCETDLRFLSGGSSSSGSWCDRNSALGLKGSWGNFFIGTWDSPIKQVTSATRMLNETGWLGAQHLLLTFQGVGYSTRNVNSVNYASPNMNGFSVNAQYTTENPARNSLETAPAAEWRHLGLNGIYSSGPLVVGLGWSSIESQQGAFDGRDDTAYALGINYTWSAFKFGFVYTSIEAERGVGPGSAERDSMNFAVDWKLGGPGMVRFGITHAGETEGIAACATCGSAIQYQISYLHSLSKRTTATIGYVMLDNGDGGVYNLQALAQGGPGGPGGAAGNVFAGDKASAFMIGLQHTF